MLDAKHSVQSLEVQPVLELSSLAELGAVPQSSGLCGCWLWDRTVGMHLEGVDLTVVRFPRELRIALSALLELFL